jgi:peptidyl-prolyl cis-trans isomerase A (cyclophilin A)
MRWLVTAAVMAVLVLAAPVQSGELCGQTPLNPIVRMETSFGPIELELCASEERLTVANFLAYVNDGSYGDSSFIHRSVPSPHVIQGGGFLVEGRDGPFPFIERVSTWPPIPKEWVGLSNGRGTIAMARVAGDDDSATSQWFINVSDNAEILDPQQFTVFGEVILGLDDDSDPENVVKGAVDLIAELDVVELGALPALPVRDHVPGEAISLDNFVYVDSIVQVVPEPTATAQAVVVLATVGGLAIRRRLPFRRA